MDLLSKEYKAVLQKAHAENKWGTGGKGHVAVVVEYAKKIGAQTVLDYGCGRGTLKTSAGIAESGLDVREYDPGIPGKDGAPDPADMIVCTDVLEHIETDLVDNVLEHLRSLTVKGAFFIIALKPAKFILPDGRNAHLTLWPATTWMRKLEDFGFNVSTFEHGKGLRVWCTMNNRPTILSEDSTLNLALKGHSLSRFGDGELRLALGGRAISQDPDKNLAAELCAILRGPTHSSVCLPTFGIGPRAGSWAKYNVAKFADLFRQDVYGSAFISRPDNAPHINTPDFWRKMRALWTNRNVTLVVGSDYGSLDEVMLRDTKSLRVVKGPRRDAYAEVARIEQEIGVQGPNDPVILCLGATATVLAERLAKKGGWALDLGHVGKFMPKEFR